jgi:tRNA G18 (ribose-2'-O)-methylase SpoU
MQRQITGFSNPTVKYLRSLRDKKHRKRAGQFLVEGLRLLEDARSMGRVPQMLVMAENRAPHELLAQLEDAVAAAGGDVITTTPDMPLAAESRAKAARLARAGEVGAPCGRWRFCRRCRRGQARSTG